MKYNYLSSKQILILGKTHTDPTFYAQAINYNITDVRIRKESVDSVQVF